MKTYTDAEKVRKLFNELLISLGRKEKREAQIASIKYESPKAPRYFESAEKGCEFVEHKRIDALLISVLESDVEEECRKIRDLSKKLRALVQPDVWYKHGDFGILITEQKYFDGVHIEVKDWDIVLSLIQKGKL